jgi:pimeloyl-ACP methyl ester carboxylesterase
MTAAFPPLPELRFAPIPEGSRPRYTGDRFSYMEAGQPDAEPLLLLHGIGANSMHWRFQLHGLSDRFRVIAWNAPGYMLSDNLMVETPGSRDYADALADFMAAVEVQRACILANSFGSRVAQCFAGLYPDRVRRMVLTGTAIGQRHMTPDTHAATLAARQAQVAGGGYGFGERVAALLGAQASPETAALVQHVLRATNPAGFLQAARFTLGDTYTPDFADRLTMPVLLIQGQQDRITPADRNASVLRAVLPDVRMVVLDGVGHLPEVEAWETVNGLTGTFLGDGG